MKARTDLVFAGSLIERRPAGKGEELTFAVDRVWKGAVVKQHVVFQLNSPEETGFVIGETYVVFAHKAAPFEEELRGVGSTSGSLFVPDGCGVSKRLDEAEPDLAALGPAGRPR